MKSITKKRGLIAALVLAVLAWPTSLLAAHFVTSYRLSHSVLTASHCPLHHQRLRRGWVRVEYGDILKWNEYCQARDQKFPDAHSVWFGGCMVGSKGEIHEVIYCERCRQAEQQWRQQNWGK